MNAVHMLTSSLAPTLTANWWISINIFNQKKYLGICCMLTNHLGKRKKYWKFYAFLYDNNGKIHLLWACYRKKIRARKEKESLKIISSSVWQQNLRIKEQFQTRFIYTCLISSHILGTLKSTRTSASLQSRYSFSKRVLSIFLMKIMPDILAFTVVGAGERERNLYQGGKWQSKGRRGELIFHYRIPNCFSPTFPGSLVTTPHP